MNIDWTLVLYIVSIMVLFIVILMIVFFLRTRKATIKQQEHFKQVHLNIAKGKKVVFSNGIYGKIVDVSQDTVDVQIKSGAVMTVSRYAISSIED